MALHEASRIDVHIRCGISCAPSSDEGKVGRVENPAKQVDGHIEATRIFDRDFMVTEASTARGRIAIFAVDYNQEKRMRLTILIAALPNMGNNLPILGNFCAAMPSVSFLLSNRQLSVLQLALCNPGKNFSLMDFIRAAGPGHGGTQRYVEQLVDAEVLIIEPGPQRRYRANPFHPVFQELRAICEKASLPDLVATGPQA